MLYLKFLNQLKNVFINFISFEYLIIILSIIGTYLHNNMIDKRSNILGRGGAVN